MAVAPRRLPTSQGSWALGVAVWLFLAAVAAAADSTLALHFDQEPPGVLVRQIEPIVVPNLPAGLTLTSQPRWVAEQKMLLMNTTVSNRGAATVALESVPLAAWSFRLSEGQDALRYRPLAHREDVWYGSTYWTGPDWTRVGKDWHHPGENTPSVRRFTAPHDGRLTISGRVRKFHVDKATDGVRLTIRHGAKDVWNAEIGGDDAAGMEPNLTLQVRKGDAVRFVVHKRGQIFCDTTFWDPLLRYTDGEVFQASKGFSKAQGEGGWSYEMEIDSRAQAGLPRVHGLGRDLALREEPPGVDRPVVVSDRDALPLIVVADGADQSGIGIAIASGGAWQFRGVLTSEGRLQVQLSAGAPQARLILRPNETVPLPQIALTAYRGRWLSGMTALERIVRSETMPGAKALRDALTSGLRTAAAPVARPAPAPLPDLDLWLLVEADWRQQDKLDETAESYAAATKKHLDKVRTLLADLRHGRPAEFLAAEAQELERLARLQPSRDLWLRVRSLKRQIILSNPLLDFGNLLFSKRVPTSYSHLVMQYFGWRARPGGGLFVLERPGWSLACREISEGRLADGNVLEPRLSYDARRVVFSFVRVAGRQDAPDRLKNDADEGFYHIWEMGVDGSDLRQLTRGPYDDLMPVYLPDGGIAFSSTRRRGYARCFGGQFSPRWHVYTLHRMDADGSNVRTLSFHDTNEWFPAVLNTGMLLYARWDYIDRDAVTHQNLWTTRPDGTGPAALWGNATPSPHCSFQAQPVPGSSKILLTASAHHSITAGSIALVDPTVARDGHAAVTRLTPEVPFPEAEGMNIPEYYSSPWPLSEKYYLVAYSPRPLVWEPGANEPNALGLYLLDAFGNRELLYRDLDIGSENPCPLAPRPVPPMLASNLPPEDRSDETGEMTLIDVYQGLGHLPRGRIKELRIVQIFPKTTHVAGSPPIGLAGEENGRAILGTVPVEADGSARLTVPARRPLLFQALDAEGFAYQTMRTVTYVQPGEKIACTGCHENRMAAPLRAGSPPLAVRRGPSPIDPGPLGGRPFSFVEIVQPVLDRHCVRCHGGEKTEGKIDLSAAPAGSFTRSYLALCGDRDFWAGGTNPKNAAEALVPRFGARNQVQVTPPGGMYGALGSRLIQLVRKGHYDAKLGPDDYRRLAAWIDLNAIFYGVNDPAAQARQLHGEAVAMPEVQ